MTDFTPDFPTVSPEEKLEIVKQAARTKTGKIILLTPMRSFPDTVTDLVDLGVMDQDTAGWIEAAVEITHKRLL